jgi:hypothetical protein
MIDSCLVVSSGTSMLVMFIMIVMSNDLLATFLLHCLM